MVDLSQLVKVVLSGDTWSFSQARAATSAERPPFTREMERSDDLKKEPNDEVQKHTLRKERDCLILSYTLFSHVCTV